MGTAYIADDPSAYGDFGNFQPMYRRGTFITRGLGAGTGIAMGRDLKWFYFQTSNSYGDTRWCV